MDKIDIITSDVVYEFKELLTEHSLTTNQLLYLLCKYYAIEYDAITASDIVSIYNKNLIVKNKVNASLLFKLKAPKQLQLNLKAELKPIGTEYTLQIAEKIKKAFVSDINLTVEECTRIADKYFKGDELMASYYIIFKSLFPVKNKKLNHKWNIKFGFIHDGISLWDDSMKVAKKFQELYKKLDIGIFLESTYRKVKDSIDFSQEKCFMTKPYKFLLAYDSYYQETIGIITDRLKSQDTSNSTNIKINNLKV